MMNQPASVLPYRIGQFFRALTARVLDAEMEQAAHVLTPAALALFCSMEIQDQRHGLDVCATLRQAGLANTDLLAAALLHDVGKAAIRLPAWQRAIIVLLERFAPRLLERLGQGEPQEPIRPVPSVAERSLLDSWRRSFVIHAHHSEIGARWAQEAGCSPLTIALIRQHQDKLTNDPSLTVESEKNQLLAALQAADNLN
jgi:predicted HD phosphohydrolase